MQHRVGGTVADDLFDVSEEARDKLDRIVGNAAHDSLVSRFLHT